MVGQGLVARQRSDSVLTESNDSVINLRIGDSVSSYGRGLVLDKGITTRSIPVALDIDLCALCYSIEIGELLSVCT